MNKEQMVEAREFLFEFVEDEYQRHHAEMVATAMEAVANYFNEQSGTDLDPDKFFITGLVHDWDYDQWPELHPGHYDLLQERLKFVDKEMIDAIKGHADLDYPRNTVLTRALLACDEFCGLLYAYCKMVGSYGDMKTKSIRKKMHKQLKFAEAIDREDILTGINELGIEESEFYEIVRNALSAKYD